MTASRVCAATVTNCSHWLSLVVHVRAAVTPSLVLSLRFSFLFSFTGYETSCLFLLFALWLVLFPHWCVSCVLSVSRILCDSATRPCSCSLIGSRSLLPVLSLVLVLTLTLVLSLLLSLFLSFPLYSYCCIFLHLILWFLCLVSSHSGSLLRVLCVCEAENCSNCICNFVSSSGCMNERHVMRWNVIHRTECIEFIKLL